MIKQELHQLNRGNLKQTYELEDIIEQIDAIKYNETMFITGTKNMPANKQKETYEELEQKHGPANDAIQGKINRVLEQA